MPHRRTVQAGHTVYFAGQFPIEPDQIVVMGAETIIGAMPTASSGAYRVGPVRRRGGRFPENVTKTIFSRPLSGNSAKNRTAGLAIRRTNLQLSRTRSWRALPVASGVPETSPRSATEVLH